MSAPLRCLRLATGFLLNAACLTWGADLVLVDATTPAGRLVPVAPVAAVVTNPGTTFIVTCPVGKHGYPGIVVSPADGPAWDLSRFGHVAARVRNTCARDIGLCLRIDNDGGGEPWNAEVLNLAPGAAGTVRVQPGRSWGNAGYALDPARVVRLHLFLGKRDFAQSFEIESIVAAGTPGEPLPVDPPSVPVVPPKGDLLAGGCLVFGCEKAAKGLRLALSAGARPEAMLVRPSQGHWRLRDWMEVTLRVRSRAGAATLRARAASHGGPTEWCSVELPADGREVALVVPFASSTPWTGAGTGSRFASDVATAIEFEVPGEGAADISVNAITATLPPPPQLPEWLGRRPPVDGDWVATMDDDFTAEAIDATRWDVVAPNYWDKVSWFSPDNAILGDGLLRLRFEKRVGRVEGDANERPYCSGHLTSYGKWTQRYGYFETRIKLPRAPGLWPAFWTMPDRGGAGDPQWVRGSTDDGGMEMDILEHLTRYGPYRYNIAFHWDGYGDRHQSLGTENIYIRPDADGYIVTGMLWSPGRLDWYCNGVVVATWISDRVCSVPSHVMYTLVAGGWGGNDLDGTGLPDELAIDWVRAWQLRERLAE